jgi:hypothetical protein
VTLATANPADTASVAQVSTGVSGNGVIEQGATRQPASVLAAGGIGCGFNEFHCYTRVRPGQRVVLRARPLPGYLFRAWSGPCAGQGPRCVIVARSLKTVTAIFTPRVPARSVAFAVRPIAVRITWQRSVGSGRLLASGRVGGPAHLRIQLRRPSGGPLLQRRFPTTAGSFRNMLPLSRNALPRGAVILPGGFVASLTGSSGTSPLPFQLRPVVIPAPREGVVRQTFASTIENGPATTRLPVRATAAWAHFRFATQPARGLRIRVYWYRPGGGLLGSVAKANRPEITSFLRSGSALPRGAWVAELRAGPKVIKRLTVRVG